METEKIIRLAWKGKMPELKSIFPPQLMQNEEFQHFCNVTYKNMKLREIKDPFEIIKIPPQNWKGKEEIILKKYIKSLEFFWEYHDIIVD